MILCLHILHDWEDDSRQGCYISDGSCSHSRLSAIMEGSIRIFSRWMPEADSVLAVDGL